MLKIFRNNKCQLWVWILVNWGQWLGFVIFFSRILYAQCTFCTVHCVYSSTMIGRKKYKYKRKNWIVTWISIVKFNGNSTKTNLVYNILQKSYYNNGHFYLLYIFFISLFDLHNNAILTTDFANQIFFMIKLYFKYKDPKRKQGKKMCWLYNKILIDIKITIIDNKKSHEFWIKSSLTT